MAWLRVGMPKVASYRYKYTTCPAYPTLQGTHNEVRVIDQLAPAVHMLSAQHQSDNRHAALVDRKNPIRRKRCNAAGCGFRRILEMWPDPDWISTHPWF